MKNYLNLIICASAILAGLSIPSTRVTAQAKAVKQEYISVDAKRRISGTNGAITYKDYEPFKTRTVSLLAGYDLSEKPSELSKYGGLKNHKTKATGFFYIKKIGNRWWGVDPDGCLYINVALNSISMGNSDRNKQAIKEKFGSPEKWAIETIRMLQENGFNCAGSWTDYKSIIEANKASEKPFAYTINWNFMSSYGKERGGTYQQPGHTGYPKDAIFVFDPEFETFCDRHARQLLATKDDPNLFGHFSDNEMPFKIKSLDNYLALPDNDPGHKAAADWIVRTQRDRGLFYQNYNLALLESKNCVGWHYFKYQDNDPTAKGQDPSNIDANKGIVNNFYEVWTPMVDLMKELNTRVYSIINCFDK